MSRPPVLGTALCFVCTLAFAGLLSAAPNPWSFESVAEHPRWLDFARWVKSIYVVAVPDDLLQRACRKVLEVGTDAQKGDPVSACIKGALITLDGASDYIDPKEHAEQQAAAKRKFVGIGLELGRKDRGTPLPVVQPLAGAPGERAGILSGDRIVEVDGVDILPLSMDETIGVMRGEAGKVMRLTLRREGNDEPIRLSAQRQEIRVLAARVKPMSGNMVYARISQFNQDTGNQFSDRLNALRFPENKPPGGLVLDLRNNPGGLVEAMVAVASVLAPPGKPVVAMMGRDNTDVLRTLAAAEQSSQPPPDGDASRAWREKVPVVVLINERTAGGAEALAQFLRETRAAKLLGQPTFGAPHVRTRRTIGGDAAVNLVTATMTSPLGRSWPDGLIPDAILEAQTGRYEFGDDNDHWLQRAAAMLASAGAQGRAPP